MIKSNIQLTEKVIMINGHIVNKGTPYIVEKRGAQLRAVSTKKR
jgi:hypothetical protein